MDRDYWLDRPQYYSKFYEDIIIQSSWTWYEANRMNFQLSMYCKLYNLGGQ